MTFMMTPIPTLEVWPPKLPSYEISLLRIPLASGTLQHCELSGFFSRDVTTLPFLSPSASGGEMLYETRRASEYEASGGRNKSYRNKTKSI
ncbi:hypothetical protein SK128_021258 [Halocaridina rubra]|uniref:Uncharacterized protein n=1 Tax=Halocaridina rubra TaxID=373956 RepID=A0AAN8XIQ9_HALRR